MGVRSGQVTAGHSLPVPTEQTPLFVFLFVTFHFPNRDFFVAKRTIKDLKGKFYIPKHVTIAAGQRKVKVFGFLRFGVYSPFDALYGQRLVALRAEMLFSVHVDRAFEHPLLLLHLTIKPFLCNVILKFCERARPKPISASAAPRRQRPVRGGRARIGILLFRQGCIHETEQSPVFIMQAKILQTSMGRLQLGE